MIIVDSHCHLNFPELKSRLNIILENAANMNVKYMQTICTKLEQMPELLEIAENHSSIFTSVGIHPCDIENANDLTLDSLLEYASHPKVIGLGETGIDLFHDKSKFIQQRVSFLLHIEAARQTNLPVIIHTRDADEETLEILQEEKRKGDFKALIHCFTASEDFAKKVLDLGLYISFSGIVSFKNALQLQEIVKWIPKERMLVETDAPYLAPVPKRGQVNEPSYVYHTLEFIANLRNMSLEEAAEITTSNFFTLFDKAKI